MKHELLAALTLALLSTLTPEFSTLHAQGTAFTYQGRLTDSGSPANGSYDLTFYLRDALVAGNPVGATNTLAPVPVSNGLFTVTLDFGTGVFTGPPRWLEIGVRTNGSLGDYTTLTSRQPLTPAPYAIYAASAGTAADVSAGSVVKSLNTLKDDVTLVAGTNVILTPSGNTLTLAAAGAGGSGIWSLNGADTYYNAGNVGIGTDSPTNGARLEVNGTTRVTPGGSGGFVSIGTPNGETGLGIIGANRADLRFDGSTLKLLAGLGASAPANGIAVSTLGNVGIGTFSPTPGVELEVNGTTRITPGGSGGFVSIGTPSGETGIGLIGANRADLRFDGSTVKLVAGFGSGAPPSTEGIAVNTVGNVGIGTTTPAHRLSLIGGPLWTSYSWTGALELGNASAIGWQANAGGQRFGIGQSTGGLYFFRTPSDPGTTGSPANYDLGITDSGNLSQARDKGGAVKAMVFVGSDGSIRRSYNSQSSTITVHALGGGGYNVDFGFRVDDRFASVTTGPSGSVPAGANVYYHYAPDTPNTMLRVETYVATDGGPGPADFTIIVY